VASAGLGFLIGHQAVAILMPLAVLALAASYRVHHHVRPLGLGVLAGGIAYLHVFAGTPEWTMAVVLGLSLVAALVNWRATGSKPSASFSNRGARRLDSSW
jgi:hypothetical protein